MLESIEIKRASKGKTVYLPSNSIFVITGISRFFIFPGIKKFAANPAKRPKKPAAIFNPADNSPVKSAPK